MEYRNIRWRDAVSEWHTYCKMKSEVAFEFRIQDGIMLHIAFIGRIDSLHTHVKPEDEIIEIESPDFVIAYPKILR